MSFLAPLFLIGAAAVIGPVILHLIRRSPEKKREFSTLMFLEEHPPVFSRRSRISNWLLLLLRCLVILLLCLAFARPFFKAEEKTEVSGGLINHWLLAVDRSASMQRQGIEDSLIQSVRKSLDRVKTGDLVALATFDKDFQVRSSWQAYDGQATTSVIQSLLKENMPGFSGTDLGVGLSESLRFLEDRISESAGTGRKVAGHLLLFSDFQKGAAIDQVQGLEWNDSVEVTPVEVSEATQPNVGLSLLSSDQPGQIRLQVSNDDENVDEIFEVSVAESRESADARNYTVNVPAGTSRILNIPVDTLPWTSGLAWLSGDEANAFDNEVFWASGRGGRFSILSYGLGDTDRTGTMGFFLNRAFGSEDDTGAEVKSIDSADSLLTGRQRFLVGAGVNSLPGIENLKSAVEAGLDFLWLPRSESEFLDVADKLGLSASGAPAVRFKKSRQMQLLGRIDWNHPIFQPFQDPQFSNFSKVGFYRYLTFSSEWVESGGGRAVADLEDGTPWLSEWSLGQGRVWLLSSGWDAEDGVLARSTKFVPLILSMAQSTGAWRSSLGNYLTGEAWEPFDTDVTVTAANNSSADTIAPGEIYQGVAIPSLARVDGPRGEFLIPVNLDPRESLCSPTALSQLEALGVPVGKTNAVDSEETAQKASELTVTQKDFEIESSQKNWKWILAVVAVVLVLETWLAGWTARPRPAGPASP